MEGVILLVIWLVATTLFVIDSDEGYADTAISWIILNIVGFVGAMIVIGIIIGINAVLHWGQA